MKPFAFPLVIDGMLGLGDGIYQTPIVIALSEFRNVYLRTPWPQLYNGLGRPGQLHFCQIGTRLRTQAKNAAKSHSVFVVPPLNHERMRLSYVAHQRQGMPFYQGLTLSSHLGGFKYFLKLRDACKERGNYAIIRPCTFRTEWRALARNPKPEYIQFAIDLLESKGIRTILLADIDPPHEVYDGPRPTAGTTYEKGEIGIEDLLRLIHEARVVVGPVGFIVPMCIALGTPGVIIHGGVGGCSAPEMINAPGEGTVTHVLPRNYCRCRDHSHQCDKEIDVDQIRIAIETSL